jgi:hypothetical protein
MFIPKTFENVEPGVIVRKEINNPQTIEISQHYENDALRILQSDRIHYAALSMVVKQKLPTLFNKYKEVVSIGGGSPKFEVSILNPLYITVLDGFADSYAKNNQSFRQIFDVHKNVFIQYNACNLDTPASPTIGNDCISFVHFLEHCDSWKTVKAWIKAQKNDIVIYGPNIEAAHDDNWFHFRPVDHNVFFTIEAITKFAEKIGYTVESIAYSDDMLVWLKK